MFAILNILNYLSHVLVQFYVNERRVKINLFFYAYFRQESHFSVHVSDFVKLRVHVEENRFASRRPSSCTRTPHEGRSVVHTSGLFVCYVIRVCMSVVRLVNFACVC